MLKHAHHTFDIDHPGNDSFELRNAGAEQVLGASRHRMALIKESVGPACQPRVTDLLPAWIHARSTWSSWRVSSTRRFRRSSSTAPRWVDQRSAGLAPQVIALAIDAPFPLLDLSPPEEVPGFVLEWLTGQDTLAAAG